MTPAEVLLLLQGAQLAFQMGMDAYHELAARDQLTPEQRQAFREVMEKRFQQPHWARGGKVQLPPPTKA